MRLSDPHRGAAWQATSLLLDYPTEEWLAHRPLLRRITATMPAPIAGPLTGFLDHVDATPLGALAADYVTTFDHQRRCSLFLTYFTHGDTRQRGVALLRFTRAYRAAGMTLTGTELPDHLAVLLEFAATGDAGAGGRLLSEHRVGVELLRQALHDRASPWAGVLDAVSATLPPISGRERTAMARLAAAGPPGEEVGLEPFGPPETTGGRR